MNIEYVTHASIKVDTGDEVLLLDPFYFFDDFMGSFMCHFPPSDLSPESFPEIDYLFSSHIHPDHCHANTLKVIRDKIHHVLLPDERNALVKLYNNLGYPEPRLLGKEETVSLSEKLKLTTYWDGTVDTALIIEADGCTILHQNDCRLSPDTMRRIAQRHQIDFAFLLYTSSQSLFPFILDRTVEEREALAEEREQGLLNYQVSCIEILKPKVVVPYSMTMTFTQDAGMHVNSLWRFTPHTFCDALTQRCPDVRCLVMHPGDSLEVSGEDYTLSTGRRTVDLWGKTKDEYVANVTRFLAENRASLPDFAYGSADDALGDLKEQVARKLDVPAPAGIQGKVITLNIIGEDSRQTLTLNLADKSIAPDSSPASPYLVINIPASVVVMLVKGEIDPFVALYTHEVSFNIQNANELEPEQEGMIYLDTMFYLFAKTKTEEIAETDGMRKARRGSPYL